MTDGILYDSHFLFTVMSQKKLFAGSSICFSRTYYIASLTNSDMQIVHVCCEEQLYFDD